MSDNTESGSGGVLAVILLIVGAVAVGCGGLSITPAGAGHQAAAPAGPGPLNAAGMPADYAAAYRDAANTVPPGCPVDAALLAAIGWQETKWGTWGVGADGLIKGLVGEDGPMQFTQATWSDYGQGSPHNIHDAAAAAVRLLCSAGGNVDRMLWRYNQSTAYAQAVTAKAAELRGTL